MKAEIKKETDDGFGLSVVDNRGFEHKIGVCYDGEIDGHLQDAYPNHPDDRTDAELRAVMEAREFARYHVYRERGYETLPPNEQPERLMLATLVVANLSMEAFEHHFGDLYQQLKSYSTEQEPVVDLPEGLSEDNYYLYAKELYLGLDDGDVESILDDIDAASLEVIVETINNSDSRVDDVLATIGLEPVDSTPSTISERLISAVSDVLVQ